MLLALGVQPGRTYYVDTDNTTTEAAIFKKQHSKNVAVNDEWRTIQDILPLQEVNIRSRRIPSKENKADRLSRGDTTGFVPEKEMILSNFPADLAEIFLQV
jgi:hypothetical protein